jgi:hypothetical protein
MLKGAVYPAENEPMTENDLPEKRGLTQQQAMAYVGAKRRTWEALWAPRLVAIKQGVCLIYDRRDLDRVFDQLKAEAASAVVSGQGPRTAAYPYPMVGVPTDKDQVAAASFQAALAEVQAAWKRKRKDQGGAAR